MLVEYNFKYSNGNMFGDDGNSAWNSTEGKGIRQQINQLIEQFGLTRESPHRNPEQGKRILIKLGAATPHPRGRAIAT